MLYLDYAKQMNEGYILNFFADSESDIEEVSGGKEFITKNGTNYGAPMASSTVVITMPDKTRKTYILDSEGNWVVGGEKSGTDVEVNVPVVRHEAEDLTSIKVGEKVYAAVRSYPHLSNGAEYDDTTPVWIVNGMEIFDSFVSDGDEGTISLNGFETTYVYFADFKVDSWQLSNGVDVANITKTIFKDGINGIVETYTAEQFASFYAKLDAQSDSFVCSLGDGMAYKTISDVEGLALIDPFNNAPLCFFILVGDTVKLCRTMYFEDLSIDDHGGVHIHEDLATGYTLKIMSLFARYTPGYQVRTIFGWPVIAQTNEYAFRVITDDGDVTDITLDTNNYGAVVATQNKIGTISGSSSSSGLIPYTGTETPTEELKAVEDPSTGTLYSIGGSSGVPTLVMQVKKSDDGDSFITVDTIEFKDFEPFVKKYMAGEINIRFKLLAESSGSYDNDWYFDAICMHNNRGCSSWVGSSFPFYCLAKLDDAAETPSICKVIVQSKF